MPWYQRTSEPKDKFSNTRSMAIFATKPATEREPTVYPAHISIKRYDAAWARDARGVTQVRARVCGGPTGSNGIGVVPRAFTR